MKPIYWKISHLLMIWIILAGCAFRVSKSDGTVQPRWAWEDTIDIVREKEPNLVIETKVASTVLEFIVQQKYSEAIKEAPLEFPLTDSQLENSEDEKKDTNKRSLNDSDKMLHLAQRAMLFHLAGDNGDYRDHPVEQCEQKATDKNSSNYSLCLLDKAKLASKKNNERQEKSRRAENDDPSLYRPVAIEKNMIHILSALHYANLQNQEQALEELGEVRKELKAYHKNYYKDKEVKYSIDENNLEDIRFQLAFLTNGNDIQFKDIKCSCSKNGFDEKIEPILSQIKDEKLRKRAEDLLYDHALRPTYKPLSFRLTPQVREKLKRDYGDKLIDQIRELQTWEDILENVGTNTVGIGRKITQNVQVTLDETVTKFINLFFQLKPDSVTDFLETIEPILAYLEIDINQLGQAKKLLVKKLWPMLKQGNLSPEKLKKILMEIREELRTNPEFDKKIENDITNNSKDATNDQPKKQTLYTFEEFFEDIEPILVLLKDDEKTKKAVEQLLQDHLWPMIDSASLNVQQLEQIKISVEEIINRKFKQAKNFYYSQEDDFADALMSIAGIGFKKETLQDFIDLSMEGVYKYDAFSEYLKGIMYEWQGDDCQNGKEKNNLCKASNSYQLALLAYNRACVEYSFYDKYFDTPIPQQLLIDRDRLINKIDAKENSTLKQALKSFSNHPCGLKNEKNTEQKTHGELITISFNGLFPKKTLYARNVKDFARFARRPNHIAHTFVEASWQGNENNNYSQREKQNFVKKMELVEKLSEIANTNLDNYNDVNGIRTEEGIDLLVKITGIKEGNTTFVKKTATNLGKSIFMWFFTDDEKKSKLNLDSWSLLPDQILISRQSLPAGDYEVTVYYYSKNRVILGQQTHAEVVTIEAGKKVFLFSHFAHRPDLQLSE